MIIRKNNKRVKEKLQWFQILTSLYEIAAPHIRAFTEHEFQVDSEVAVDLEKVDNHTHVLQQLLSVINNLPEPPEDQLNSIKKDFYNTLSNCISANTALIKYVQSGENSPENQGQVHSLIISLVLAREYAESTYKRLSLSLEQ